MNKKPVLIVVAVVVLIVAGYFIFLSGEEKPAAEINIEEKACIDSGGTVTTVNCCKSGSDFPNSCLIGACGCSPENSKPVKFCDCGTGCWNGVKCVKNQIDTNSWQTYINPKYPYFMKYPTDWTVKHDFGPNEILGYGYYESNVFEAPNGYALVFAVAPKNEDVMPVPRTGVGAGDFIDTDETVNIGGTEVGIKHLVFEGKVKEIFFDSFEIDTFKGKAYLSYFGSEDYKDSDMAGAGEVEIAKAILESFEFISENSFNPGDNVFCGRSTSGSCGKDSDCISGGCSGQVCQSKSEEPVITTCEYRDCYNAATYNLTCGCKNNQCQWK
jgi:eight-cysteine-cluster-containing protein